MDNKSQQIKSLMNRLAVDLKKNSFIINDHWDGDLLAIGISHPVEHGLLVYISVYEESNDYFAALELPSSTMNYESAGEFHHIKYAKLVEIIRRHLELYKHAT